MEHRNTYTITKVRVPIFGMVERVECDDCGRLIAEASALLVGLNAAATDSLLRKHSATHGWDAGAEAIIDEREQVAS